MIKKGIISNKSGRFAEASLPDENYTVTAMLPLAKSINEDAVKIGDTCVIAFFDSDYVNLADGVIIAITGEKADNTTGNVTAEIKAEIKAYVDEVILGGAW